MRPAVDLQDVVVEVFHPQTEPGDSEIAQEFQLTGGQRAGLAFEGDLPGVIPGEVLLQLVDQSRKLTRGEIGGCSASEVDEVQFPAVDEGPAGVEAQLPDQRVQIAQDLPGAFTRVDLEIAEVAALAQKGMWR